MSEFIKRRRWGIEEWRAVSAQYASSRLSVLAFCTRESINLSSFYRCRERWGAGGMEQAHSLKPMVSTAPTRQPAFVDLGSLRSNTSALELRLDLGEGVMLTLVRR
jgi:hypothetical protein